MVISRAVGTVLLLVACVCSSQQERIYEAVPQDRDYLEIGTYNVRYDSQPNQISIEQSIASFPKGVPAQPEYYANTTEQPWSLRRFYIANDLLSNHVDILGGQELLKRQVNDLAALLGDGFEWVGVGRDDGKEAGEYEAIFYSTDKVTLVGEADQFWLSDTPFEPSKYPDAGSYRLATVARFETVSGKSFSMINTHLDEQSGNQRKLGMSLILHRAKYEAIKCRHSVILTGDFNSPPDDGAYQIATGVEEPVAINQTFADTFSWTDDEARGYEKFSMVDLAGQIPPRNRLGSNYATFTDFNPVGNSTEFSRLDYVMANTGLEWEATQYRVEGNVGDDGVYHSDHRLVIAQIGI